MSSIRSFAQVGLLLAALGVSVPGHAEEGRRALVPSLPAYQQECASCHAAYPPGLLPAESWRRIMRGLPAHFGTDASLDPATVRQLSGWLEQHAAPEAAGQAAPPDDRITRSAWFQREHGEISTRTWQLPNVRSASNCAACHVHANQGVFDEHDVRIPR